MLILTGHNSPRFHYACEVLLNNYNGSWELTDDVERFKDCTGIKIEYGRIQRVQDSFFIPDTAILWTDKIEAHEIKPGNWNALPTLYPGEGNIPFDIFSAIFFLITRYEEYLTFQKDKMNRFAAIQSIAYKYQFMRRPIVDLWRQQFEREIEQRWPEAEFKEERFHFLATIDVDSAFAYKHKGLKRTLGGFAKDIFHLDFGNLFQRVATLAGMKPDVYDTYDYIATQCLRYNSPCRYFFLLSDFGQYDKNVPHTSKQLRGLIRRLSDKFPVGIHPGVASNSSVEILKKEKQRLEEITEKKCNDGRQHYLMLFSPKTYQSYMEVGITDDYTMGYADEVGFRAGTSCPFKWFDLVKNEKTELTIHPFAAMDTTMKNYLSLTEDEAITVSKSLMKEVRETGGHFISLWHNESLSESSGWKGWRRVWEATLAASCESED